MILEILVHEVSYQGEAAGRVLVWHFAHENLQYHTVAEPKNKFIVKVTKILKQDNFIQ